MSALRKPSKLVGTTSLIDRPSNSAHSVKPLAIKVSEMDLGVVSPYCLSDMSRLNRGKYHIAPGYWQLSPLPHVEVEVGK